MDFLLDKNRKKKKEENSERENKVMKQRENRGARCFYLSY